MKRRLAEFESLTPAEEKLLAEIGEGRHMVLGDGEAPGDAGAEWRFAAVPRWYP